MITIAIDPGASGGYAYRLGRADSVVASNLPGSDSGLVEELRALHVHGSPVLYIEAIRPYSSPLLAASLAKVYGGYRFIVGVALTLGYRIVLVQSKEWQEHFALGSKKEHGKRWKNHLKDEAQRRFPEIKVTLKTADALLMLEYAMSKKSD